MHSTLNNRYIHPIVSQQLSTLRGSQRYFSCSVFVTMFSELLCSKVREEAINIKSLSNKWRYYLDMYYINLIVPALLDLHYLLYEERKTFPVNNAVQNERKSNTIFDKAGRLDVNFVIKVHSNNSISYFNQLS